MSKQAIQIGGFLRDNRGSAYMVNYLLVIPFIILFLTATLESVFYFQAVIGLEYATFAASRSTIVWFPQGGQTIAENRAKQAAAQAMTPFAYGMSQGISQGESIPPASEAFLEYHQNSHRKPLSKAYFSRKHKYAFNHLEIEIEKLPPSDLTRPWNYDFLVKVKYQYHIHIPIVAKLLGHSDHNIPLTRSLHISCEAPKNEKESLGVNYD